jgi:hypothetical protein
VQQRQSGPTVQLDDPDPMFKEAKPEDATDAVTGGLTTVKDELVKNEAVKDYGLALAKRHALPIWSGMSTADKGAVVGFGAGMSGLALGSLASSAHGRATLSDQNLVMPLKLVPYATLDSFQFHLPQAKTDPFALRFSLNGDDLLELAHTRGGVPRMTLSFDFTLTVAPDGKVAMPYALATFGVLPGLTVAGGWGLTTDWKPLIQPRPGSPLVPDVTFPQPAQPAPRGGAGVFVTIDLLKLVKLPAPVRAALGGDADEQK